MSQTCARAVAAAVLAVALTVRGPAGADPRSDCEWRTSNPEAVIEACTALLESQKAKAWMHFNRGLAHKLLGRLAEAERDYSKAIELDPKYAAAFTNRGNVRLLLNNTTGALADYRKAIKLDPKDQVARQNLKAIEAALRKVGADKSGKGVTSGTAR